MIKYCIIFSVVLALAACGKDNNSPAPQPPIAPDTLGAWTNIATSIFKSFDAKDEIADIYFTSPANGFLVASDSYIYKSADSGKTWLRVNDIKISALNIFFVNASTGFFQGRDSIAFTFDGGQTWGARKLPYKGLEQTEIWFTSASTGFLSYGSLYRTTDSCKTWQQVPGQSGSGGLYFFDKDNGRATASNKFIKTSNGGDTWAQVGGTLSFPTYVVLQYVDNNTAYFSNGSDILKTTDDGLTWNSPLTSGPPLKAILDLAFITAQVGYACDYHSIYKTTNGGATWAKTATLGYNNLRKLVEIYFINENTGWACTSGGDILRLKL